MVFGSLGLCEECGGQLRVQTHSYSCAGFISDWTKCDNSTTQAKRRKWIIPKHLKEYDFLLVIHCMILNTLSVLSLLL